MSRYGMVKSSQSNTDEVVETLIKYPKIEIIDKPITMNTILFLITPSAFVNRKRRKPSIGYAQIAIRIIENSDIFQVLSTANDPAFKRRRSSVLIEVTEYFYCSQAFLQTLPASDLKRLLYNRFILFLR